jgi:tetratricopeptide (TPR) repeat protein
LAHPGLGQNQQLQLLSDSLSSLAIDMLRDNSNYPDTVKLQFIMRYGVTKQEKNEVCFTTTAGEKCYGFNTDSVFNACIKMNPDDYVLQKMYADFLFSEFENNLFSRKDDSFDVATRMNGHYRKAWENGVFDSHSLYAMGYYCTLQKQYNDASQWYSKSLAIDSLNPLTNYSMAVSQLLSDNSLDALPYSLKAVELYSEPTKRSDAARMAGIALYENGRFEEALNYFTLADSLSPGYMLNQTFLLRSRLQQNLSEKAVETANIIFSENPHNPDVADRIYELFRIQRKQNEYKTHIDQMKKSFSTDHEALGNLKFHYGKSLYLTGKKSKAIKTLKESKKHFTKVLPPNHQVFEALEDMLIKK